MNEKIKELALQAGGSHYPGVGGKTLENFALLIIKECYEECKGQMLPDGMAEAEGYTYNDGVMDCAIGLLQRFGVEE